MPDIYMDVDTALSEVPVNIFPLTDDTDFKTRETAVAYNAAGMDLVWNFVTSGGAFTQTAVTPTTAGNYDWTHQGDGMYTIEIPASGGGSINNDTEGYGWFTGFATGVLPWRGPVIGFRAAALNDALCDGGDNLDVNVTQFGGTNATTSGGRPEVNTTHAAGTAWGSGAITAASIASDAITAAKIANGAIDAATFAADVDAEILSYIVDDATRIDASALNTATGTTIPAILTDTAEIGAAGAGLTEAGGTGDHLTAVPWNASWDAEVQSEVADGLNAYDPPTRAEATSDKAEIVAYLSGLVIAKGTIGSTGNDTTHLHLTGLTFGDDEINNYLLAIQDVSTGEWHARYIEDWADTGDLATVATLPFTPQNATDTYAILAFRQDVTGGSGLDAAGVRAAIGLASANLDTQLGTIDTNVDAILVDTSTTLQAELDGIQADTEDIQSKIGTPTDFGSGTSTIAANLQDLADNGTATYDRSTDSLQAIKDAVATTASLVDAIWDEPTSGHTTAGTTGKALTDASSAGDPWSTALPGAYSAGTAGKIIGDNLNATVSSRATQTSVDTIDTNVDAILVDTADMQPKLGTPAGADMSADIAAVKAETASILTDTGTTLDGKIDTIDTVVDAIKAKTDSLTFTVAGQVDSNVQYVNDTAVTGDGQVGTEWGPA